MNDSKCLTNFTSEEKTLLVQLANAEKAESPTNLSKYSMSHVCPVVSIGASRVW